jgi:hypothetical protein
MESMAVREVRESEAVVRFSPETATVSFSGALRLANVKAYESVAKLLAEAAGQVSGPLTLDFKELKFLNSSGITALSLFVVTSRKAGKPQLRLVGAKQNAWQQKSLANFQMLWKDMQLVIE